MRGSFRRVLFVAGMVAVIASLAGCSKSEEQAVQEGLNPATPIRKAFAVSLEVYAQQISQQEALSGRIPQGDGIAVLERAGIRGVPGTDPWGNEVRYHGEGSRFTLSSAGPDGQWGTRDDIVISK
jgi:hypothetical protein